MLSRCLRAGYILLVFFFLLYQKVLFAQGCPTLNSNATLTSADCQPNVSPCTLCPNDQFTLTATGMKVLPGDSVKWYFSTTPNFNPYNGQGTYLGYSPITVPAPNSCNPCLSVIGIFVDGCGGSEPQGEFAFLWSGGGFFLDDLSVDYATQNNNADPLNDDIGGAGTCGWQMPSQAALNVIQDDCPGTTIVPVGPGGAVPPTSPVIFLSSSGFNFNYNFNPLCLAFNTIYVVQSSCNRTVGAYSNGTSNGLRNTVWALDCGCEDNLEYNCNSLVGGDGAFVANTPIPGLIIYGNTGCANFPSFPPPPGGSPPPITIEPFTATVTSDMCNQGPFYVVGIYRDLPAGCAQTLTNYMQFDVDCPNPTLGTGEVCESVTNFNLVPLQDPNVPNGTWSGPGVNGNTFNANGLSGAIQVTFTPSSPCGTPANTTITVNESPTASLTPITQVCEGDAVDLEIFFTGTGPWNFQVFRGATQIGNFTNQNANPFILNVTPPNGTSTYSIQNVSDANCVGTGSSIQVNVIPEVDANLTLSGNATICKGESAELTITFNGGNPPFEFNYTINGVPQGQQSTNDNPHTFNTPTLNADAFITLIFVESGGCEGNASGNVFVNAIDPPEAELEAGTRTICISQRDTLLIDFLGDPPFTFVYQENGINQPAITTTDNPYELIVEPTNSGTYTYTLESVENNTCDGPVSGQYVLTVSPAPEVNLTGDANTCPGQSTNLIFTFSGSPGPYTVSYTANNAPQTNFTTSNNPATLSVSPTETTVYSITGVSAPGGCTGTFSGDATVTVGSTFDATITGTQTICNGQQANLTFTFTGTGPYTVDYTRNGIPQTQFVANASPFTLSVTPPLGINSYVLTSVVSNGCNGNLNGNAIITVNPGPSAVLETGNSTICQGQKDTLLVTLSGGGPYNFTPAINGVNQPSITTSISPFPLILMPGVGTNVITITNVNNPTCPGGGSTSGTFTIQVNATPNTTLTGDLSICAGSTGKLIFNFTGSGPWTANYTVNGTPQTPLVTSKDPDTINVTPIIPTTYILTQVSAGGCISTVQDTVIMAVSQNAVANLETNEVGLCQGNKDTITITFGGGGPYTFTYTINGVLQPTITTPGPTYDIIHTPALVRDTFRLVSVNSPGCPGGNVAGQYISFAKPVPSASMPNVNTILCGAGPVPLILTFGGSPAPWTLNYTANNVPQVPYTAPKSPDTILVDPTVSTTYVLTSVSANGCTGMASGTSVVTVKDTLRGVISGGGQICQGGTGTYLIFTFSGQPGPYTYTYETGFGPTLQKFTRTTTKTVDSVFINPPMGGIYRLTIVKNNECTGVAEGAVVVGVFVPSNAKIVTPSATFCDSAAVNLEIDFNGTAPFIIFYNIDGVPQTPDTTSDDPYFIPVKVFKTTTYTLTGIQSPGCTGNATGSVTLTVNYTPKVSNVKLLCTNQETQYSVSFDVTGVAPFTIVSGTGTFSGNTFTSNLLPVGSNYLFEIKDSKNCNSVTVSGVGLCGCLTDAGTMGQDTLHFCEDAIATVASTVGAVLESGDTLLYILHRDKGNPPTPIFAWSNIPSFGLQTGMKADTVYYISGIVGSKSNGRVDLTDPCLSIADGTPIIFHSKPKVNLLPLDTLICPGETIQVQLELSGTPPFTIRPVENGIQQPAIGNINGLSVAYTINPLINTVIVLDSIADKYCPIGTTSGKLTANVSTSPKAIDVKTDCRYQNLNYVVTFKVSGGVKPFKITGMTGKFVDSTFTSDPIAFGTDYEGILSDALNCGTDTIKGNFSCPCITDAGTMTTLNVLRLCEGDTAKVLHLGNQILDGNDILVFVLHTSMDTTLGTILATSNVPNFAFIPGVTIPGTTYYISPLAGNSLGINQVSLADSCVDASKGTPILWTPKPTATISGNIDVCPGVPTPIPVKLTGTPPYTLTYTNNGSPVTATALSNNFGILANLQQTTTYLLQSVKDANGCVGTVSGQAVVTVHQPPDIQNVKIICSPDNLNYTLEFEVKNADLGPGFIQLFTGPITGTYNEATGKYVSNAIPKNQAYNIFVTDAKWGCGQDSIKGVSNCGCSTKAGTLPQAPITICIGDTAKTQIAIGQVLEANDTIRYLLVTTTNPATWTILANSKTPNFPYMAGTTIPGTTYFIVAVAGNAIANGVDIINDPCLSLAIGSSVLWRVAPTAAISGSAFICKDAEATLTFTFTGTGPFNFTYTDGANILNGNTTLNTTTIKVKPSVTTTYTLSTVRGIGNCSGTVSGNATITVREVPTANISGDTLVCPGSSYNVPVTFTGTGPFTYRYAINGVTQPPASSAGNTTTFSINNIQSKQEITLISLSDASCPGTINGKITIDVKPIPEAILSGGSTICVGDSAVLNIELKGVSTGNVTINGGTTPIQLNGINNNTKVTVKPTANTVYTISNFTPTGNNCTPKISGSATVDIAQLSATALLSDYNGFNLSCPDFADGSIKVTPSINPAQVSASWSNGFKTLDIKDLIAGTYTVTLTSNNGCIFIDSFTLNAPAAIVPTYRLIPPTCTGDKNGSIVLQNISGGIGPFRVVVDGKPFAFNTLPASVGPFAAGDYSLVVTDANGCTVEETVNLITPAPLTLDLGRDTTINFGDSVLINPIISTDTLRSFVWTPVTFLKQASAPDEGWWAKPPISQSYRLELVDTLGCRVTDEIRILVNRDLRVFVPNIIRPESDRFNDYITVYSGPEVVKVKYLRIFDRWGDMVFQRENFLPNIWELGWNGRMRGDKVNPAVFVYTIEVEFFDGTTKEFNGDITVIR
jgi:large repetitive protein